MLPGEGRCTQKEAQREKKAEDLKTLAGVTRTNSEFQGKGINKERRKKTHIIKEGVSGRKCRRLWFHRGFPSDKPETFVKRETERSELLQSSKGPRMRKPGVPDRREKRVNL